MNFFPTGRHTSFESTTDSSQLIGIDEQEKQIRDLISEKEYRVIGVYGIAGSGKTALIHKVVNSSRRKFSRVIWLCLSDILSKEDEEFEVNIVKFMLCELDCDVDRWTDMDPSMAELLKRLKEELLKSNKYLIVFDDVWEENEFYSNLGDVRGGNTNTDGNGNKLWEALPRGTGGKIIITSRLKEVAEKMVGEKNLIHMKPLNNENCRMIVEDGIGFLSPSVREKFERKIWVPVSQIFLKHIVQTDAKAIENIGKEIVKYMLKGLELNADYFDIDDLQAICESLRPQKYLIVLIDVWHKNYGYRTEDKRNDVWKKLSRVWPKDGEGTVIVTSEAKEVAEMLVGEKKNLVHVRLPELGSSETSEVASDHQYISDELVNQCNGLPLAAKTLANIIREKDLQS
ncbi:disease resistance RPP13-like protein 4 [Senna tora]|uniref:Disease resistance RPP13-like protein 4 n=1 Tax=Senna tora TaxID=362788 RepID=A0A834XCK8_9FABA|nr:disease resistance RPP13-like protein 4 [Senna tora]